MCIVICKNRLLLSFGYLMMDDFIENMRERDESKSATFMEISRRELWLNYQRRVIVSTMLDVQ